MIQFVNPSKNTWAELSKRPTLPTENLDANVRAIFTDVQNRGDAAVLEYTEKFDQAKLTTLAVSQAEIDASEFEIDTELRTAIEVAKNAIYKFHESQREVPEIVETTTGVRCWRESRPIQRVGIYIPGGTAPLFSTVLMLGIPAKLAGCAEIVLCTPPDAEGKIHPAIRYAADRVGITKVFAAGGAQAVAALTSGTESIPAVMKIFGPGNQYVTAAKQLALQFGVAIDMPAGPSEVLIIADEFANPEFTAADLLSQAEHGTDSQVILLSNSSKIIEQSILQIQKQLQELPRAAVAAEALANSKAILFEDLDTCFAFSNVFAPEHLILALENAAEYRGLIQNAGSVFLGRYSCESAGDYASGTNHTLPTNGYARQYSGVSLDSFIKKITFQEIDAQGIKNLGPTIEILADAEGLQAHKNAVTLRLQKVKNSNS
ncbi:histidinol dehydrogenase [Flavobacterium sp.]|uniref:histidinol dehydrogenase n=1 Tax=Flavobacterium sp. TaxID=239 RepID=UPI002621AB86|nr:histidinol dehydrogenase [Flavobacterium sp.]